MSKSTETPTQGSCRSCRRPWRDILSSKCEHGVFKDKEGIEYTYHTVGSGITTYHCISFKTKADWLRKRQSPSYVHPSTDQVFDEELADIERSAWQVLDRSGLLNPKEDYQLPGAQGTWNRLLNRLEESGYREAIDEEFHAARILAQCAALRDYADDSRFRKKCFKGVLVSAISLGRLVELWRIRFGYVKNQSKTGGITRGKRQTANRVSEWAKWQAVANEIWKKHPTWGKPAVAGMIQKQFPNATVRTIRLRIEKPAP